MNAPIYFQKVEIFSEQKSAVEKELFLRKVIFAKKKKKGILFSKIKKELKIFIHDRDGHRCLNCGSTENLTLDHIIPLCMGGLWQKNNLQTLCRDCNNKKGKQIIDYR